MADLFTVPTDHPEAVENTGQSVEKACDPVVITVREVAFSTAAAAAPARTRPAYGVIAAVRALLSTHAQVAVPAEEHAPPRHYPPHHYPPRREAFLESAAMAREMRRL